MAEEDFFNIYLYVKTKFICEILARNESAGYRAMTENENDFDSNILKVCYLYRWLQLQMNLFPWILVGELRSLIDSHFWIMKSLQVELCGRKARTLFACRVHAKLWKHSHIVCFWEIWTESKNKPGVLTLPMKLNNLNFSAKHHWFALIWVSVEENRACDSYDCERCDMFLCSSIASNFI